ncbi:conserved hypothetical protein [Treponema primitia ZAS-2]|uniref:Lipoprotein n=1 Tax=Treponema primitia (strain ATCC BAA-887 / DSM 12427 / ZAS-2) TaxID=545694 RepID=F5YIY5_TREPZ|nr:hypothetical protein [Treponema primitia]AEF85648.1 conserved hypothetical protein [Treponema primitia ZAS-2]
MKFCKAVALLVLLTILSGTAFAQSSSTTTDTDKPEFPLWARDLRRAEIIAFGAFPFMVFFSSFSVDSFRAANHDWDTRYAPWPIKSAGAVEMTTNEYAITFSAAITGAVLIALADHLIIRHKRAKAERELLALPKGDIIILRKPWPPEETDPEDEESPDPEAESEASAEGATGAVP